MTHTWDINADGDAEIYDETGTLVTTVTGPFTWNGDVPDRIRKAAADNNSYTYIERKP